MRKRKKDVKEEKREERKEGRKEQKKPREEKKVDSLYRSLSYMLSSSWIQDNNVKLGFPDGWEVKNLPATQEIQEAQVPSLGGEDPMEEEMATDSSILVWRIPWIEEPGGLQSMWSQRVREVWATEHTRMTNRLTFVFCVCTLMVFWQWQLWKRPLCLQRVTLIHSSFWGRCTWRSARSGKKFHKDFFSGHPCQYLTICGLGLRKEPYISDFQIAEINLIFCDQQLKKVLQNREESNTPDCTVCYEGECCIIYVFTGWRCKMHF